MISYIKSIPGSVLIIIGIIGVIALVFTVLGIVFSVKKMDRQSGVTNWVFNIYTFIVSTTIAVISLFISIVNLSDDTIVVGSKYRFAGMDWRVLEVEADKMLIISEYVLLDDNFIFGPKTLYPYWLESSAREYLNDTFYNAIFREDEQVRILETTIPPDSISNATLDKIFLMSTEDALRYFPNDKSRIAFYKGDSVAVPWLLRSVVEKPILNGLPCPDIHFAQVHVNGEVDDFHGETVNTIINAGFRPAMWIMIDSS